MSRSLTLVFDRLYIERGDPEWGGSQTASMFHCLRVDDCGLIRHLWDLRVQGFLPVAKYTDGLDDTGQKGIVHDDPYGMPLEQILPGELARAFLSYAGLGQWDQAILAFLVAGPGCPVILYWS